MLKSEQLRILSEKVSTCTKCPELVANRTQVVFGEGNPDADVVLVGEACGRDEDRDGHPFIGRSGQLLNNIIAACGWRREDLFITNTCLCRPPNNRTPTPEEASNCRPFLDLQIRIIKPKIIICLGACAAQNLLGTETSVGNLRHLWHEYEKDDVKCLVRVTYHPSYLLRNPAKKPNVQEDMQAVIEKLVEIKADLQNSSPMVK